MTISKLFTTVGILLIIWALISGFSFYFSINDSGSSSESSYNLKIGSIVIGAILIILGRRMR